VIFWLSKTKVQDHRLQGVGLFLFKFLLGWFGVAALLSFENAIEIAPSEIILGLSGWMLISEQQTPLSIIFLAGLFAAIVSVFGASIAYMATRLVGRPLVDKLACWVWIDSAHIDRAEKQFQRWGNGLVLIGRVMLDIWTIIYIPAGLARLPFFTFFMVTIIGSYISCTLLIGADYVFGKEWTLVSTHLKHSLPYLLKAGCIALAIHFWFTRRSLDRSAYPFKFI